MPRQHKESPAAAAVRQSRRPPEAPLPLSREIC